MVQLAGTRFVEFSEFLNIGNFNEKKEKIILSHSTERKKVVKVKAKIFCRLI